MNLGIEHASGQKIEGHKSSALSGLRVLARPPVAVGVFLLLYGLFGLLYYTQQQEQDSVSAELARVQRILRKVPEDKAELEDRLMAAQESLIEVRESFPLQKPAMGLLDSVLKMAGESGVNVFNTQVLAVRKETIAGVSYTVSPFDLQGKGSLPQIISFLEKLESGDLPTVLIGRVDLAKSEVGFALNMNFAVYGRAAITDGKPPVSHVRELSPVEVVDDLRILDVPYVAWDEDSESGVDYVELYYKVDNETEYAVYTTPENPEGKWSESPINFSASSGKAFEFYTIAVDRSGNREETPASSDALAFVGKKQ
ncbi:MAG: hypothetical protein HYX93_04590 [Chloroflexi bacterium]|nr:hypothetical protein [Chloroflexota bacterium]